MASLSTFNLAHAVGELFTAADVNRIEQNVEYAVVPNIGIINSAPNSSMSSASFAVVGSNVSHQTYTGRVLLIGHVQVEVTSLVGGNPDISVTVTRDGTNVVSGNALGRQIMSAVGYFTIPLAFVVTGISPGTNTWDVRYAKNGGASPTARYIRLSVIDI